MAKKYHLLINTLPVQDLNFARGVGRYTYEVISHILELYKEKSDLFKDVTGITLVSSKKPDIRGVFKNIPEGVNILEAPGKAPHRNLLKLLYYIFRLNPVIKKFVEEKNQNEEEVIYFLPRHQILAPKEVDYTVAMIHDITPLLLNHFHKNKLMHLLLKREYMVYMNQLKDLALIVANSQHTLSTVKQLFHGLPPTEAIPLGSDLYTKVPNDVYSRPPPMVNKYFVYYGGYDFNKNIHGVIKAFGAFIRRFPDTNTTQLVFSGGADAKKTIVEYATREGILENVVLAPRLSDEELIYYLIHSQGLFRLSFMEGFGLPELEALSLGVPVISSTAGAISEFFSKHATLHDPQNPKGITEDLYRFTKSTPTQAEREQLQTFGRQFNWRNTAIWTLETILKQLRITDVQSPDSNHQL
jgi:glycosyltransferase involved in cell wall biosynthesis